MKKIVKSIITLVIVLCIFFGTKTAIKKFNLKSGLMILKGNGFLITDYSNLKDSGLTGSNYSFDSTYNPYYAMLSDNGKMVYKQVYANMVNFKSTFVPVVNMKTNDISNIIEAVNNDNPEIFWVAPQFSYKYTSDKVCRQVTLSFNSLAKNYKYNKSVFDSKVNEIVSGASKYSTNYEKELYVHDILRNKIIYDEGSSYNQTAYSALVNGRTVCAGYSKAFQYIMSRLGIPTYYVTGRSEGEDHAWNIVMLGNGFYNVDLTWDDAINNHYTYFNKTDSAFNSSHLRGNLSKYLPSCNSTLYAYNNIKNNKNDNPKNTVKNNITNNITNNTRSNSTVTDNNSETITDDYDNSIDEEEIHDEYDYYEDDIEEKDN